MELTLNNLRLIPHYKLYITTRKDKDVTELYHYNISIFMAR